MVFLSGKKDKVRKVIPGDLYYTIKTTLRVLPEYEIYHKLYGIPKNYDLFLLQKIQEYQSKQYPLNKIKYNIDLCQQQHLI
jgi:hypothetical protein